MVWCSERSNVLNTVTVVTAEAVCEGQSQKAAEFGSTTENHGVWQSILTPAHWYTCSSPAIKAYMYHPDQLFV